MITINSYVIVERQVYEAVALAISKLMTNPEAIKEPEKVVDNIAQTIMESLCDVLDFGSGPVRFTPNLMRTMWSEAQQQAESEKTETKEGG
jgi:hypothetical protein